MSGPSGSNGAAAPRYWFPAKRHGWGWGLPITWQGWTAMAVFAIVLVVGEWLMPPFPAHPAMAVHGFYAGLVGWAFIGVCYLKGEPPRWRWGSDR